MERELIEYNSRGKNTCYVLNKVFDKTSAYVIGLLAADGGYGISKRKYHRFSFYSSEEWSIKAICNYFRTDGIYRIRCRDISITNDQGVQYDYNNVESFELDLPSKSTESLMKFGIVKHKKDRVLAGIPKEYFKSAMLGFFDGDGSIVIRHRKDCRTPRVNVHIVTGATIILNHIQNELHNNYNISSSIYVRNKNCSELRINNTDSAIKFFNLIYSELPEFYNHKKYKIFKTYMDTYYPY